MLQRAPPFIDFWYSVFISDVKYHENIAYLIFRRFIFQLKFLIQGEKKKKISNNMTEFSFFFDRKETIRDIAR